MAPERDFEADPTLGPFLSAALLCERVLEEKDGVKSAIRIVDQLNRQSVGPNPPSIMEPFQHPLALLLRFKAGAARGTYKVDIKIFKPSNTQVGTMSHPVHFPGPDDAGIDIVVNIVMPIDEAGTWWFDISVDEKKWMKVPLRVVYLPQQLSAPGT